MESCPGSLWIEGLLFKSDVAQVVVINADDAVVFLEERFPLRLSALLQPLHQQTQRPAQGWAALGF